MDKAKTQQNVVHFINSGVGQDSKAVLACQNRKATVRHGTTKEPITCKRCFTQRVHDLPTALAALGIDIAEYRGALYKKWEMKKNYSVIDQMILHMPKGYQVYEWR